MPAIVVMGAQWGDEGKGKATDQLGNRVDYCVRYSAEDAKNLGFDTVVIEEACKAIDLNGSAEATRKLFRHRGIELI